MLIKIKRMSESRNTFVDWASKTINTIFMQQSIYSLDFVVNRLFMKLFRTSDTSVIAYCREMFQFDLPSAILKKRAEKFDSGSLN